MQMANRKWSISLLPFEELRRIAEERARWREEERVAEERKHVKLR
jgi:hypothetical protein